MMEGNNHPKPQAHNYIKDGLIEFSKLGLQFLFLANGSAIIAILAHIPFFSMKSKCVLLFVLVIYILGLLSAFFATFSAYMCHRNLTEGIGLDKDGKEKKWFCISLYTSIVSFLLFAIGSVISVCYFIS